MTKNITERLRCDALYQRRIGEAIDPAYGGDSWRRRGDTAAEAADMIEHMERVIADLRGALVIMTPPIRP